MAEIVELKKNGKQLKMTFEAYISLEDIIRTLADEEGVDFSDLSEEDIINDVTQGASADLPDDITDAIFNAVSADLIEALPKCAQSARMVFAKVEVVD